MSLDLTRQSGILPSVLVELTSVHIVGAGAVGSHTAEVLAKMGISKMKVTDFDTIEAHNLPNQGYYLQDLGSLKVVALGNRLRDGCGVKFEADTAKIEAPPEFSHEIVVSAVDSMAVRKTLWEGFKKSKAASFFVDGRMGARYGKVLVAVKGDPESMEAYEASLFDDSEGFQAPCTEKATIFCAYALGALIGGAACQILTSGAAPREVEVDLASMRMSRSAH